MRHLKLTPSIVDARVADLEAHGWSVSYSGANANYWFIVVRCDG